MVTRQTVELKDTVVWYHDCYLSGMTLYSKSSRYVRIVRSRAYRTVLGARKAIWRQIDLPDAEKWRALAIIEAARRRLIN